MALASEMSMGASGSTGSANSVSRENGLRIGSATDEENKWSCKPRIRLSTLGSRYRTGALAPAR